MLLSPDWYTTIPNCANLIYLSADVIFSEKPIDLREEKFVENCGALFIFDFHLTRVFFFNGLGLPSAIQQQKQFSSHFPRQQLRAKVDQSCTANPRVYPEWLMMAA